MWASLCRTSKLAPSGADTATFAANLSMRSPPFVLWWCFDSFLLISSNTTCNSGKRTKGAGGFPRR